MNLRYACLLLRNNQDDFILVDDHYWTETMGSLFVVVDGQSIMEPRGVQVASQVANTLYSQFYANTSRDRLGVLRGALQQAHVQLSALTPTAKAACGAVLICQGLLFMLNVGHTRVYMYDQSRVFTHTGEYSLNGCLGDPTQFNIETWVYTLDQACIVLCTDGLYRCISEAEMESTLRAARRPEDVTLKMAAHLAEHSSQNDSETEDAAAIVIMASKHEQYTSGFDEGDALAQPEPLPRGPQGSLDAYAYVEAKVR